MSRQLRVNSTDVVVAANNYAYLHYLLGNYSESWKHSLFALEVVKSNDLQQFLTYIMNGQGDVLREIDEFVEARKIYLDVVRLAEKHENYGSLGVAFAGLAVSEAYEKDFNQAMYYLREQIRVQQSGTDNSGYQASLGWVYFRMGQSEMALKSLRSAVKAEMESISPSQNQALLYYHYALALTENGEDQSALDYIKKALEITALLGYDQFLVNEIRRNYRISKQLGKFLNSQQFSSMLDRSQLPCPSMNDLVQPDTETITEKYAIHVSALNDGAVHINSKPISPRAWSSVGAKALFFFIVDRKRVKKNDIALEFWPDFSPGKVNSNFHATLWRVRKGLEIKNLIAFIDDYYQINPDVDLYYDVEEYEEIIDKMRILEKGSPERSVYLRRALELYHQDFLPDIDMPWADDRRRELQNSFLRLLVELGETIFKRKHYQDALEIFQRAVELDPYQDNIHLLIVQCLVIMGDSHQAKNHYDRYASTLQNEMGITPSEDLTQFIVKLG